MEHGELIAEITRLRHAVAAMRERMSMDLDAINALLANIAPEATVPRSYDIREATRRIDAICRARLKGNGRHCVNE